MLSFYKYVDRCNGFEQELKQSLTRDDMIALRNDCAEMGLYGWYDWVRAHDDIIAQFVEASPSARKKSPWRNNPLRHLLVLAAIQYVTGGRDLLQGIDTLVAYHGCSYREMAAKAGRAYLDVFCSGTPHWPFDGPSPFEET